jgi:hypothetical protein
MTASRRNTMMKMITLRRRGRYVIRQWTKMDQEWVRVGKASPDWAPSRPPAEADVHPSDGGNFLGSYIDMKIGNHFIICSLLLLFSIGSLLAASQTWYLPGAAETPGMNGAQFSSTLFLCNRDSTPAMVQIALIPYAGKTAPAPETRELAAGESLSIPAVLKTLFGLTSDAGTLVLSSENTLGLWLNTANVANPAGTYGLALEACNSRTIIPAGSSGYAIWASQGSDFRTNIALTLLDSGSAAKVTVYDDQGQSMGTTDVNSSTPVSWQVPITNLIGEKTTPVARVEVSVLQGRAVGYTAVVDNVTNDGIAVMAELPGSNPSDLLLNGVALASGVNNTHWSTDVRLFNPSAKPVDVMIQGLGFNCGKSSFYKSLPAASMMELSNVLGQLGFSCSDGTAGGIRLQANGLLMATGRTTNSDPSGVRPGSFSAYERSSSFQLGFLSPQEQGEFIGIEQVAGSTGFRTNMAFLAGSAGASANLILYDRMGNQQATTPLTLTASQWSQQNVSSWFAGATVGPNARVEVQVTSGMLDGYISKVDNGTGDAVVLPMARVSSRPQPPQISGCQLFPEDNPWNLDVSGYPVDPKSDNYIAHMNGLTKKLHADFGASLSYGIPYVVVPSTQPKVPMVFDYSGDSDPGPYPIPPDAPIEGTAASTGDRHVLVLDATNHRLYETWDSHYTGPGWHCGSGAIFDLTTNQLRPDYWTSADAAGLPILPGLIRYDEAVTQQEINHAVRFTVASTQRGFIHPATHFASSNTDPNAPPMGLRLRLKSNFDISSFHGTSKVILTAMKKYGLILADNGSDWYITGATDIRWNDDDLNQLKTVPGSAFEVVQTGTIIH